MKIGKIIGVSNMSVLVLLAHSEVSARSLFRATHQGQTYYFEVASVEGNIAHTVPLGAVFGLKKGIDVELCDHPIQIEYSDEILGRVFDPYGRILAGDPIASPQVKNVYEKGSRWDCWAALVWEKRFSLKSSLTMYTPNYNPILFSLGSVNVPEKDENW